MICASAALVNHRAKSNARRRAIIGNTPLSAFVAPPTYNQRAGESEI
jgi:hypothetical protein